MKKLIIVLSFTTVKKSFVGLLTKKLVLVFSFDVNLNIMHDKIYALTTFAISGKKQEINTDNLRAFWKVLDLALW